MKNNTKFDPKPKTDSFTLRNVFTKIIDWANCEYDLNPMIPNWTISPFINQREFKKELPAMLDNTAELFVNSTPFTYASIIIFVHPESGMIYLIDGGQRISKIFLSNIIGLKFFMSKNKNGIYNENIEEIKKDLFHTSNNNNEMPTPKYQFRFDEDKLLFKKVERYLWYDEDSEEDTKMLDIVKKGVEFLERRFVDKKIQLYRNNLDNSSFAILDYTKTGMNESEVYDQVSGNGKEHKPYELVEGILLCKVNDSPLAETYATKIHNSHLNFDPFTGGSEKKEVRKEALYELVGFVYFGEDRHSGDIDRQTLTVKNGGLKERIKEVDSNEGEKIIKCIDEVKTNINKWIKNKNLPCAKYLFDPSLNPNFYFWKTAYVILNELDSLDSKAINDVLQLLCCAFTKMRASGATCDAQFEISLLKDYHELFKNTNHSAENAKQALKEAIKLHTTDYWAPISGDEDIPDSKVSKRNIISDRLMKKMLLDEKGDWFTSKGKKDAARFMLYAICSDEKKKNGSSIKTDDISLEHNICQFFCENNGLSDYMHSIANLSLLNSKTNSFLKTKPYAEKIQYAEVIEWNPKALLDDSENGIAYRLKRIEAGESSDAYTLDFKAICKMKTNLLRPYFATE